eukprot:m51a1_g8695 putative protein kinase domain containing protein (508) ;mRNA; r:51367-54245
MHAPRPPVVLLAVLLAAVRLRGGGASEQSACDGGEAYDATSPAYDWTGLRIYNSNGNSRTMCALTSLGQITDATWAMLFTPPDVPFRFDSVCVRFVGTSVLASNTSSPAAMTSFDVQGEIVIWSVVTDRQSNYLRPGQKRASYPFRASWPMASTVQASRAALDAHSRLVIVAWEKGAYVGVTYWSCARVSMSTMRDPFMPIRLVWSADNFAWTQVYGTVGAKGAIRAIVVRAKGHPYDWRCGNNRTEEFAKPSEECDVCGDSVVVGREMCDKGLFCNATTCACLPGHLPYAPPLAFCSGCGNGVLDPGHNESCDGGSGCGVQCQCLEGWTPTTPKSRLCVQLVESRRVVVIASSVSGGVGLVLIGAAVGALVYARRVRNAPRPVNIPQEMFQQQGDIAGTAPVYSLESAGEAQLQEAQLSGTSGSGGPVISSESLNVFNREGLLLYDSEVSPMHVRENTQSFNSSVGPDPQQATQRQEADIQQVSYDTNSLSSNYLGPPSGDMASSK